MHKFCTSCTQQFAITAQDLEFYQKISPVIAGKKYEIPPPTLCPACRQQRRLAFRNERKLYKRHCNATGEPIITIYSPDSPFQVYKSEYWWSDAWNPLDYGQNFDFQKPFFPQFGQLMQKVPRINLYAKNNENSDYSNHCDHTKNAYLCVDTALSEDTFYSKWLVTGCRSIIDCYHLNKSELCYQCLYANFSYNCMAGFLLENCRDSAFLYDCKNCANCFMCTHLRNKQYCLRNQQLTKEEYEREMDKINTGSFQQFEKLFQEYQAMIKQTFHQSPEFENCENCTGDFLENCKNCRNCYELFECEDCTHCFESAQLKDCLDTYEAAFDCELQYETHACNRTKNSAFCSISYDNFGLYYCDSCHNCRDCFGCIGLRRQQYCIFNKKYAQQDYEKIVPAIIEHMQKTGEWGQFFPIKNAPFAYNESIACEYLPLSQAEALQKGYRWQEEDPKQYLEQKTILPDNIQNTDESITNQPLSCASCQKNYKILPQEFRLYQILKVPLPRKCPHCRHLERMSLKNPIRLWTRQCANCQTGIESTFPPERGQIIYCEECYLKAIH